MAYTRHIPNTDPIQPDFHQDLLVTFRMEESSWERDRFSVPEPPVPIQPYQNHHDQSNHPHEDSTANAETPGIAALLLVLAVEPRFPAE